MNLNKLQTEILAALVAGHSEAKHIAEHVLCRSPTVTENMRKMEKYQLVTIVTRKDNRRYKDYYITDKGRREVVEWMAFYEVTKC